jgi:hypothetical protein
LVWKFTKKLGISFSVTTSKDLNGFYRLYVVAEYSPAGNYETELEKNVLPLNKESMKTTSSKDAKLDISSKCLNAFREMALEENNEVRSQHVTPELKLNDGLNAAAQNLSQTFAKSYDFDDLPLGINAAVLNQFLPFKQSDCECILLCSNNLNKKSFNFFP